MRRRLTVLTLAALALPAGRLVAQGISAAPGGPLSSLPGLAFDVPIVMDMTGRPADRLGAFALRLTWDTAKLRLGGGGAGSFGSITVREDSAAFGVLTMAGANPAGVTGIVSLANLRFTPSTTDTATIGLGISQLFAAGSFADLLPYLTVSNGSYCNARGRYGDIDGDGNVNSRDALLALSAAVGLPTTPFDIGLGDVNSSGTTTATDALIMLSYAVGLNVSGFRVLQLAPGACGAAGAVTLALLPSAVGQLLVGQEVQFEARAGGAGGSLGTLVDVVWRTSDANIVGIGSGGTATARAPGTATITAVRDGRDTVSVTVTVVARRTHHLVDARAVAATNRAGTPELPFATLHEALGLLAPGDTIDIKPGRYEGLELPASVVLLGQAVGDSLPVIVPGSGDYGVLELGAGRFELKRIALEGPSPWMLLLGELTDTVELDSIRIAMDVSACSWAAIAGGYLERVVLRRVRLIGDGAQNGCADGLNLGPTRELLLEDVVISDFGGTGVIADDVDSITVRRSHIHNNGGYGLSTWISGSTALTSTALVLDSVRLTGEYSYGLLYAEGLRRATIARSRFIGGGYSQSIYLEGYYDSNDSLRGYVQLLNDSITAPDAYWIDAYGLDSLTMDSVRAIGVGDSWIYNVWKVRAERSTFEMSGYYGSALYASTGGTTRRTAVAVDSVTIRGSGCQCATGIQTYNATLDVRRLRASNLDEAIYHYDSTLSVTESVFESVYEGVYAYSYSDSARALIRNVTMTDVEYGVDLNNFVTVVDSSSFTRGWQAVELSGYGRDTVRVLTINDYEDAIETYYAAALIENNQIVRPYDTGIYVYRYTDYTPAETTVVRRNTITCALNQYADVFYVYYSPTRVDSNTVVNGCYRALRAYNDNVRRPLSVRGNTFPFSYNGASSAIDIDGNYRTEIVGNVIDGPADATTGGTIDLSASGGGSYARVDSNTIRHATHRGIYASGLDTLQVRGNLIEDFRNLCCFSYAAAISAYAYNYGTMTRVVGNTVRRAAGNGIFVYQAGSDTAVIDTNAVSQADTAALHVLGGTALVRGNNVRGNARLGLYVPAYYSGNVHQVHGNALSGNGQYAVRADYDSVDASGNWWGVNDSLPGRPGTDSVFGRVNASAPLSAEPAVPALAPRFRPLVAAASGTTVPPAPERVRMTRATGARSLEPAAPRTLRRAGDSTLVLRPPAILSRRADQVARAQATRAAADSARAAARAAREQSRGEQRP